MPTLKERDNFIFGRSSDLPLEPKTEAQVQANLFKDFDPAKMMDSYEAQLGIKVKEPEKPNTRYKSIMLSLRATEADESDPHAQLFMTLMNDTERFQVVNRTQYWTPRGELKLFIEYVDNLDVKKKRESKEQEQEHTDEQTSESN